MKQLLYISLFLLFSCKIIAQSDIRIMGGGINGTYYANDRRVNNLFFTSLGYTKMDVGISYYYNSFHQIKNSPLYFTTGSKIFYSVSKELLNASQRFGIGFHNETEGKKITYYNIGGEFNFIGLGMYGNANILIKGKKNYFVISPEINVINYDMYAFNQKWNRNLLFVVGCGIAAGWDKKEFVSKEHKKYAVMNHFNANISIGSFNKQRIIGKNLKTYHHFINVNANYRFFAKQIISPEIGIGLMISKGQTYYNIYSLYPRYSYGFYAKYTDIMPYMQLGFGIQTRRKVAFIGNFNVWSLFNVKAIGAHASMGIKYGINNNIALSLSPTIDAYSGNVYGKYQSFEKENDNSPYQLKDNIKGLHKSGSYDYLYGIKLGVHF